MLDAAILGGGPAGATAGLLLARWGHSVALFDKSRSRARNLAETLPPSIRNAFHLLGIQGAVDAAGFRPATGNTVWWDNPDGRVERFPSPGYSVRARDFDLFLLDLAGEAGVHVRAERPTEARFTLDCSGRAGVIARQGLRRADSRQRTIALCGVWRSGQGWPAVDPAHTLVEAYPSGWVWSVPTGRNARQFTVMTDFHGSAGIRRGSLPATYRSELAKTRVFKCLLADASLTAAPWACDASIYSATRFTGADFLLVGDAASTIDPLSSFGVKKAMTSAWVAAVVVHTCLIHPHRTRFALELFEHRERQFYAEALRQSAEFFRQAPAGEAQPFWEDRAGPPADAPLYEPHELTAAFDDLKVRPSLRLERAEAFAVAPWPVIEHNEVVLRESLAGPSLPPGVSQFRGVDLPRLVELAPAYSQVPDLYETYNRLHGPAPLPDFLAAMAFLIAKGALRHK